MNLCIVHEVEFRQPLFTSAIQKIPEWNGRLEF